MGKTADDREAKLRMASNRAAQEEATRRSVEERNRREQQEATEKKLDKPE